MFKLAPLAGEYVLSAGADGALRRFEPALVYSRRPRRPEAAGESEGGGEGEGEGEGEGGAREGAPQVQVEMLFLGAAIGGSAGFWDSLALFWPTRLAANTHELVLKSGNHDVLRRLLCLSAGCDWGDPFALFASREQPQFSALHEAVRLCDRQSVRLLLSYVVQLKR
ncbi:hypothetical protein T492DRAFT_894742 [Pavlovales sp. CCMP2436]|nr:hypothetical protein T492DRAFT_894742 [Pavlovales sp. CCMP2436]